MAEVEIQENINVKTALERINKIIQRNQEYAEKYVYSVGIKKIDPKKPRPKCAFPECDKDTVGRKDTRFCDDHNNQRLRYNLLKRMGLSSTEATNYSKTKNILALKEYLKKLELSKNHPKDPC